MKQYLFINSNLYNAKTALKKCITKQAHDNSKTFDKSKRSPHFINATNP